MSDRETHADSHSPERDLPTKPSVEFAAVAQPSYARTLFLGSDGLRSGWGLLLYALLFLFLQRLINFLLMEWAPLSFRTRPMITDALSELAGLIAALIPGVVMTQIEKRSWDWYGLPLRKAFGKAFWIGAIWGFCSITALIITLCGVRDFSFGLLALHGLRIAKFAAYWAGMFLMVGLFEEFLLRGYTQFTLARGIGFWPAAITLSLTFGLVHLGNEGEQWRGLVAAACIGFFFCLTLWRTGNLWFAVGFHAAWDWGETFFYSVPDSGLVAPGHLLNSSLHGSPWLTGGSVGPEGSALCFVVIAITWVAFDRVYPNRTA